MVVTSPPYAMQRAGQYEGVTETEFPAWMVEVMESIRPKLSLVGSVFLVIRSSIRNGVLSDYVMRTRLAIREAGWAECEEIIWLKPDAPPLGHTGRPRRTWEQILWFSKSGKPYVDLYACGLPSRRIGFAGSRRFGLGGTSPIHQGQNEEMKTGRSKVVDTITAPVGTMDRGVQHPAMYPRGVPEYLIGTFSQPGQLVLDPFVGSGTTCLVARDMGRSYLGFDLNSDYVRIARMRLDLPLDGESPTPSEQPCDDSMSVASSMSHEAARVRDSELPPERPRVGID